jgi:hypothetical protein
VKGTLRDLCISLLGAAAAGSLILGLTRLIHPLGTQDMVAMWVVGVAVVCVYPLLFSVDSGARVPPGTMLVGVTGLLIFSNHSTDYLAVPACLLLALLALRTLPDLAAMKAPLLAALAGATLDLAGGLFWLTGQPLLKELSWWGSALGGGLVFAGLALAAGRPTTRGFKLPNVALACAALGVAAGWMSEAVWELIARVFVPYNDAYIASAFPDFPWTSTVTGMGYLGAATGLLLLLHGANAPRLAAIAAGDGDARSSAMRDLRTRWSRTHIHRPSQKRDLGGLVGEDRDTRHPS